MADGVARRYVLWAVRYQSSRKWLLPVLAFVQPLSAGGEEAKAGRNCRLGAGGAGCNRCMQLGKGGHEELLLVFRQLVIQNTAYECLQIKYLNDAKATWTHSYSILNDIRTIIIIHEDNYQNYEKCSEFEKRSNWLTLQPVSLILMLDGRKKDHYRILICFWKDTGNPHKN